jgi:acyl-CoA synthetase (NDP forming)
VAAAISSAAATSASKPVLASVLGQHLVLAGSGHSPIPSFAFPETAARALAQVAKYAEWRTRPEGTVPTFPDVDHHAARLLVSAALTEHLGGVSAPAARRAGFWLDPSAAIQLMDAYRVPVVATRLVSSVDDAVAAAEAIGYPVALRGSAPGSVRLRLADATRVAVAYRELEASLPVLVQAMAPPGVRAVVEVIPNELFGPLVALGASGGAGQPATDLAFRALPLSDLDAHELVTSVLGTPGAELSTLQELLLRVGRLVEDIPELAELSLDPVIAAPGGAQAAGVRVRLAPSEPHPERAIRRLR